MVEAFLGTWKLVDSKNFDDYMKSLGEQAQKRVEKQGSDAEWGGAGRVPSPALGSFPGRATRVCCIGLSRPRVENSRTWTREWPPRLGRGVVGRGLSRSETGEREARKKSALSVHIEQRGFGGRVMYDPKAGGEYG